LTAHLHVRPRPPLRPRPLLRVRATTATARGGLRVSYHVSDRLDSSDLSSKGLVKEVRLSFSVKCKTGGVAHGESGTVKLLIAAHNVRVVSDWAYISRES